MNTLHELFVHTILDLYSAETQLSKVLPELVQLATNEALSDAFAVHAEETERQIERLKKICDLLGITPGNVVCEGMKGLLKEATMMVAEGLPDALLDVALVDAAQKVEHYEIAGYMAAASMAEILNLDEVRELLEATLIEEDTTSTILEELATEVLYEEAA